MQKCYLLLLCIFFSLSFISAEGLRFNPTSFETNKTYGIDSIINLQVINLAGFPLYNLSMEDNPYISLNSSITQITSGQVQNISLKLFSNISLANASIRLRGYYPANVGPSSQTWNVNITSFESKPCDMSVVQGDTVIWKNLLVSAVSIVDASSSMPLDGALNIQNNATFQKQFINSGQLRYYVAISGFQFPQFCTITILPQTGIVNDPQLDARINFKVNVNYESTSLNYTYFTSNYTMNFFDSQPGVFSITNNGNRIAKNVVLSGDWFNFNQNNFDMNVGQTVVVSYSIAPMIMQTNQTNKTYNKNINIKGNFNEVNIPFTINIPYALIGDNNTASQSIADLLGKFCIQYPKSKFCNPDDTIVYQSGYNNSQSDSFNISMTVQQWKAQQLAYLEENEIRKTESNLIKEKFAEYDKSNNESRTQMNNIEQLLQALDASNKSQRDEFRNITYFGGGIFVIGFLAALIFAYQRKQMATKLNTWKKS